MVPPYHDNIYVCLYSNARGRNKAVLLGQVGLRCKWCKDVPQEELGPAAISFPSRLDRMYQAGQSMAAEHLIKNCKHIPSEIREQLIELRKLKSTALGGKQYWSDAAKALGIIEGNDRVWFRKHKN